MSVYSVLAETHSAVTANFMNQQKRKKKLSPSSNNWLCLELQIYFHFIYLPLLQKVLYRSF